MTFNQSVPAAHAAHTQLIRFGVLAGNAEGEIYITIEVAVNEGLDLLCGSHCTIPSLRCKEDCLSLNDGRMECGVDSLSAPQQMLW
ncbi:MAG TPA: hypothetical protein PLD20_23365, partial [Blastocatellia bacterium]|nr:hypothetical protein [Blastocatellia bacterium]HNG34558.1 hypothetical protein [Blastocatellia bacterium]